MFCLYTRNWENYNYFLSLGFKSFTERQLCLFWVWMQLLSLFKHRIQSDIWPQSMTLCVLSGSLQKLTVPIRMTSCVYINRLLCFLVSFSSSLSLPPFLPLPSLTPLYLPYQYTLFSCVTDMYFYFIYICLYMCMEMPLDDSRRCQTFWNQNCSRQL